MTEPQGMFGEKHVRRYRETNGDVGHLWHGSTLLLPTTTGRNSGEPRTRPLAYVRVGDNVLVLASNGGAPEHPGRDRSLAEEPQVEVQVKGEVFRSQSRAQPGGARQRPLDARGATVRLRHAPGEDGTKVSGCCARAHTRRRTRHDDSRRHTVKLVLKELSR